jgi:hypothetical protein
LTTNSFNVQCKKCIGLRGFSYTFFCELTKAVVFTTQPIRDGKGKAPEEAAREMARPYFNHCPACGRWVCDEAYDVDEMKCVACVKEDTAEQRQRDE